MTDLRKTNLSDRARRHPHPGHRRPDADAIKAFEAVIPMRRVGEPDKIGRAALFLASDLARHMTGAQLVVDGGRLLV